MKTYATPTEFLDAVKSMAPQEKLALEVYADRCIHGTQYSEASDIIHEAIFRVLDGRRHWPRGLDLAIFLANSVKSIASGAKQRHESTNRSMDWLHDSENGERPMSHESAASSEELAMCRERQRMSEAAMDYVRTRLHDDLDGVRVLNGMAGELSPAEMRREFAMSEKAFAAARARVVNRLKIWAERHPDY